MTQDKDSQADTPEGQKGKKPKRVAKTLLESNVDISAVLQAAKELDQAQSQAQAQVQSQAQSISQPRVDTVSVPDSVQNSLPEPSLPEPVVSVPKPETKRRVAKTLLFGPGPSKEDLKQEIERKLGENSHPAAAPSPAPLPESTVVQSDNEAPAVKKTTQSNRKPIRKIAKTLLFMGVDEFTDSGIHPSLPEPASQVAAQSTTAPPGDVTADSTAPKPSKRRRRGTGQYVAKTMLDHSILAETVLKSVAKLEVRVKEELKERANEPVKPFVPVPCEKETLPCAWRWTESGTAKRFKVCELCQKNVYDFEGIELPEAEKIVFQRENLEKFTLYKRPDGKFMTSDCPVQLKRKSDANLMIASGIAIAVAVVVFLSMLPHPPKPAVSPELPGKEAPQVSKIRKIDHTMTKPDEHGTYHYRSDDPVSAKTGATTTAPVQPGGATAVFPEPAKTQTPTGSQEGGDFWVNPDGGTNGSDTVLSPTAPSSGGR